jgi:cell division initiation protein
MIGLDFGQIVKRNEGYYMLTPQEVAERSFPKAKFGGYGMAEVDEFLDVLTEDYGALYKENTVLKGKMKVLVEKIAEYRSTEDAMRTTLLTAQKMASTMITEAEEKKTQIVKEAESAVQERLDELHKAVADEQARLEAAQSATASLVSQVRDACKKHLAILDSLPQIVAPPSLPPQEDPVEAAADDIDSSLSKIVGVEADSTSAGGQTDIREIEQDFETVILNNGDANGWTEAALDELEAQTTRRIDFDNLQFGRDYEVK